MTPKLTQLRAEKARLLAEANDLVRGGDYDLEGDELEAFQRIEHDLDALAPQLAELEDRAERIAAIRSSEHRELPGSPEVMIRGGTSNPADTCSLSRSDARSAALRMLERSDDITTSLTTVQRDRVDALIRTSTGDCDGSYIAKRTVITESDAYRSAWQRLVTNPRPILSQEEVMSVRALEDLDHAYNRDMNEGSGGAGSYGIPVLIDPSIIPSSQGALNPFRRISRQESITTNAWKGVSSDGVSWSYDAEGTAVSDDSATLVQPTVTMYMERGFVPWTIELGTDYPSFAEEMARMLDRGRQELEAQKFAVGNGTTEPRGIVTALAANSGTHVHCTTSGAFSGYDINSVWSALPDRAKSTATWVMSHSVGDQVATFGNGLNLSFVTTDLTGFVQTLRSRPVEFSSYTDGFVSTTTAANFLVVGSFIEDFLIVDRTGMSVELVPFLFDTTSGRPNGHRGWFAYPRNGCNTLVDTSFRLLQNT